MFRVTSNAWSLTGDGVSLAYRHGLPMQDMEFYQFHPTGIVGIGILLSEAARGEGGYLLDNDGFRFMERYAPKLMELAPRDMVSRAIVQEIRAGRGIDGKDYVYLDVRHLGRKVIEEKLPDITDFARVYQGVEPITEPVPIQPTAHYAMGGIPTNLLAQVTRDADGTVVPGLYAAGEAACVSVHGANRLGTNSLVDLLVFGRRAGRQMAADVVGVGTPAVDRGRGARAGPQAELEAIRGRRGGERAARLRTELAEVMMDDVGVYRDDAGLRRAPEDRRADPRPLPERLRARQGPRVQHRPARGARARLPARLCRDDRRLGARRGRRAAARTAARTSRSATTPTFLAHTLATKRDGAISLAYKPVTITTFQPKPRTY